MKEKVFFGVARLVNDENFYLYFKSGLRTAQLYFRSSLPLQAIYAHKRNGIEQRRRKKQKNEIYPGLIWLNDWYVMSFPL